MLHQSAAKTDVQEHWRCSTVGVFTGGASQDLIRKHVLHTELGLKEEWRGASQSDWLWSPTCLIKQFLSRQITVCAPPGDRPIFTHHKGEKSGCRACSPLLTTGERCIRRCYNLFPSELLELISIFKCLSFASQGGWIWELPIISACFLTHINPPSMEETFVVNIWRGPAGGQHLML